MIAQIVSIHRPGWGRPNDRGTVTLVSIGIWIAIGEILN
jgi:hypothetical protein